MGKFRSKLKGQTKGKRWPKGHSSVSNPETRKFRDAAKAGFFQQFTGPSNLTLDAVRKHEIKQTNFTQPKTTPSVQSAESSEMDDVSSVGTSTYRTLQSWASDWTGCSNMSYSRFLQVFRSDSALHKDMLAMLAAVTEVIKMKGGAESTNEYYCALFTTLETVMGLEERRDEEITAALSLINMGIKGVSQGVLVKTYSEVIQKLMELLTEFAESDNNAIIKAIFGILSVVIRNQEFAIWSDSKTMQIFNAMLNPFCIHSKPKWRKSAQQAVIGIIKASTWVEKAPTNPPADKLAEFCEGILNSCMGSNASTVEVSTIQTGQTTILHTLGLVKETICNYSKSHIKTCCEIALRLMKLNYPLVTSCSLQVLYSLFSASKATVPAKLNAQIITALYECQPSQADVQPSQAWLLVMQQAHVHLSDVDLPLSCLAMPQIFAVVTQLWLSEKVEIVSAATRALEIMLQDALTPAVATPQLVAQHKSKIEKCIKSIEAGLGYQFNTAWHHVLYTLKIMFDVCGSTCQDLLASVLKSLSELRDSYKFSYNSELEHAVGAAIRSMGPEAVLNVISITKDNGDLNIDRSWMIPVLKENTKRSTLNYFVNGILPLAVFCQKQSQQYAQINDGIRSHSYELFYNQLWNLLPSFCNSPTDIKNNFKNIAKVLGTAIADKKELRLPVMASLRKLITSAKESENADDIAELTRFDKNYLPILFNVYTTKPIGSDEEGQRLAALDTIKTYLTITKPDIVHTLFVNALQKIETSQEDAFIRESVLDLIRALVPYLPIDSLKTLFDKCIKPLHEMKQSKEQKKAYRLLEEMCASSSENCKEFIKNNRKIVQKLLLRSLNSAAVSSKAARLRCLNYLVKAQPHLEQDSVLLKSAVPEAVLCCKDINEKCRAAAYQLLNSIGETLQAHDQMDGYVSILVAGLTGTQQIMSCTILALASALHYFSGGLGQDNIKNVLANIGRLMGTSREIVGSCLSFIKVYLTTMPNPIVASSIPEIMKGLVNMSEDCKRHFRIKIRDILDRLVRKYGCECLTPHVPSSDTVMYKRLRNLRKLNARKKRQKESKKDEESEEENEEDFIVHSKPKSIETILADSESEDDEEMETDDIKRGKNKKTPQTWIEEDGDDIVDFTDNKARSKITATKPGQNPFMPIEKEKKKKESEFKTAPDGRLIITGDDDSDSDIGRTKNKMSFSDDSNDSGEDSDAETRILVDRKRKRSDAASMKSGLSVASSIPSTKYQAGGSGIHRPLGPRDDGSVYKAKKAKGDIKKKGKVDPYAYLPLQRNALNKRKKAKNAGRFKNLIKSAKVGAQKGMKAKKKF